MTTVTIHKIGVCDYCSNKTSVAELYPSGYSGHDDPALVCLECLISVSRGVAEVVTHDAWLGDGESFEHEI